MKALAASELRQRLRGRRWWLLLAGWTGVLYVLVAFVRSATRGALQHSPDPGLEVGAVMFGSLALLVLALACLVLPSLSATSINGERDRGTLAVLQVTLLRPWEIVAAKLASATITAAVFLAATLPIALWCWLEGGVGVGRAAAVYLILLVVSSVLIALALAASALVRKPALSAVLAYGLVFVLTIGSPILFGIALASAPRDDVPVPLPQSGWRWLLLAPDPFVVLADAAPASGGRRIEDPLSAIRQTVRLVRFGDATGSGRAGASPRLDDLPALWPAGLAIELALSGLAVYASIRRLRIPARRLAPGERIA